MKMPNIRNSSCNIGGPEVRRRKIAAIFSGVLSILTGILLLILDAPSEFRLVIFIPILLTVIGWFQTKRRFCLAYGMSGVFNLGELGNVESVVDPEQRRKDRSQVIKTIVEAVLIAAVPSILFVFI
ncbi:MAG: hypothetical protein H7227_05950 [Actinobacteria bacterium]|nr:hypothetical protein [Actinomycetota bacterium]